MGLLLQILFTSALSCAAISASEVEFRCLNGGIIRSDNSTCDCADGFSGEQCELQLQLNSSKNDTADLISTTTIQELQTTTDNAQELQIPTDSVQELQTTPTASQELQASANTIQELKTSTAISQELQTNAAASKEAQATEVIKDKKSYGKETETDYVLIFLAILPNVLIPFSCVFAWFISTRECCQRIMVAPPKPLNLHIV
uniref:EGF-like domain-containing protein n=1 Tax=Plectus sambesii TaxID=2011161 RepID=A0A914WFJ9_9BILA